MGSLYLGNDFVVPWNYNNILWGAKNPVLLYETTKTIYLNETNYSSLTPSTSSQTLQLPATAYTANPGNSITVDIWGEGYHNGSFDYSNYDYCYTIETVCEDKYNVAENTLTMPHLLTTVGYKYGEFYTYPNSISTSGEISYSVSYSDIASSSLGLYRKANGDLGSTTNYGIYHTGSNISCYPSQTTGTLSAGTYNIKTVVFSIGYWYMRASTTYHDVSAFNYINPATTNLKVTFKLYQIDKIGVRTQNAIYLDDLYRSKIQQYLPQASV